MRRRRGSVILVTVIAIALSLISMSTMLSNAFLTGLNLPKTSFRETVTQLSAGGEGTYAIALAEMSKNLNSRVKTSAPSPYFNWTKISFNLEETNDGLMLIQEYINNIKNSTPHQELRSVLKIPSS